MIVNGKSLMKDARERHYGIGAFNIRTQSTVEIILGAAEETNTPVLLQISDYADPNAAEHKRMSKRDAGNLLAFIRHRAESSPIPVVIHLDHCRTFEGCIRAIQTGATSVMIDGSMLSFEENVAITNKVIEAAHGCDVAVEAEIGHVGRGSVESVYTSIEDAKAFYEAAKVDMLAVSIGTIHGPYKSTPALQYDLIAELRDAIPAPLVMHGASGLEPGQYRQAVAKGICKINFSTYLQLTAGDAIRKAVLAAGDEILRFEPLLNTGMVAGKEFLKAHIGYFGTRPIEK